MNSVRVSMNFPVAAAFTPIKALSTMDTTCSCDSAVYNNEQQQQSHDDRDAAPCQTIDVLSPCSNSSKDVVSPSPNSNIKSITGKHCDIEQRYHIETRILGAGLHGSVREGIDRITGEHHAIKSIRKRDNPHVKASWIVREIALLSEMKHDNIIHLKDVFEDDEYVQLLLIYVLVVSCLIRLYNIVRTHASLKNTRRLGLYIKYSMLLPTCIPRILLIEISSLRIYYSSPPMRTLLWRLSTLVYQESIMSILKNPWQHLLVHRTTLLLKFWRRSIPRVVIYGVLVLLRTHYYAAILPSMDLIMMPSLMPSDVEGMYLQVMTGFVGAVSQEILSDICYRRTHGSDWLLSKPWIIHGYVCICPPHKIVRLLRPWWNMKNVTKKHWSTVPSSMIIGCYSHHALYHRLRWVILERERIDPCALLSGDTLHMIINIEKDDALRSSCVLVFCFSTLSIDSL